MSYKRANDFWADRRESQLQRAVSYIEHMISETERQIWDMQEADDCDSAKVSTMSPQQDRDLARLKRAHIELCIVLSALPMARKWNAQEPADSSEVW
jgi:hypothetical protein